MGAYVQEDAVHSYSSKDVLNQMRLFEYVPSVCLNGIVPRFAAPNLVSEGFHSAHSSPVRDNFSFR